MNSHQTYQVSWDPNNRCKCIIHAALTNQFMIRGFETPEERSARKDLQKNSKPEENLRRLMKDHLDAQWKATKLYDWFEQHAPGYKIGRTFEYDIIAVFAHIDHAVLFKLSWT